MRILSYGQGTPDWLAWRKGGLGASDAPVLMGVSPYTTREQLLAEKVTGERRETNFAMRRGNRLEPTARELYRIVRQCDAAPQCVMHDSIDWLLASLDGLCHDHHGEEWIAEIKCWRWQNHDLCLGGVVPDEVYPQIQHQLLVTGLTRCDLVSYTEADRFSEHQRLAIIEVAANPEYQAELLAACAEFWAEVVEGRVARKAVMA